MPGGCHILTLDAVEVFCIYIYLYIYCYNFVKSQCKTDYKSTLNTNSVCLSPTFHIYFNKVKYTLILVENVFNAHRQRLNSHSHFQARFEGELPVPLGSQAVIADLSLGLHWANILSLMLKKVSHLDSRGQYVLQQSVTNHSYWQPNFGPRNNM